MRKNAARIAVIACAAMMSVTALTGCSVDKKIAEKVKEKISSEKESSSHFNVKVKKRYYYSMSSQSGTKINMAFSEKYSTGNSEKSEGMVSILNNDGEEMAAAGVIEESAIDYQTGALDSIVEKNSDMTYCEVECNGMAYKVAFTDHDVDKFMGGYAYVLAEKPVDGLYPTLFLFNNEKDHTATEEDVEKFLKTVFFYGKHEDEPEESYDVKDYIQHADYSYKEDPAQPEKTGKIKTDSQHNGLTSGTTTMMIALSGGYEIKQPSDLGNSSGIIGIKKDGVEVAAVSGWNDSEARSDMIQKLDLSTGKEYLANDTLYTVYEYPAELGEGVTYLCDTDRIGDIAPCVFIETDGLDNALDVLKHLYLYEAGQSLPETNFQPVDIDFGEFVEETKEDIQEETAAEETESELPEEAKETGHASGSCRITADTDKVSVGIDIPAGIYTVNTSGADYLTVYRQDEGDYYYYYFGGQENYKFHGERDIGIKDGDTITLHEGDEIYGLANSGAEVGLN